MLIIDKYDLKQLYTCDIPDRLVELLNDMLAAGSDSDYNTAKDNLTEYLQILSDIKAM